MHFEYKWGRTLTRLWRDTEKTYGPQRKYISKVINSMYSIECKARQIWPAYASYEEDKEIGKNKWDLKYTNERLVMWDMTDIGAYAFSDADL